MTERKKNFQDANEKKSIPQQDRTGGLKDYGRGETFNTVVSSGGKKQKWRVGLKRETVTRLHSQGKKQGTA